MCIEFCRKRGSVVESIFLGFCGVCVCVCCCWRDAPNENVNLMLSYSKGLESGCSKQLELEH